MKPPSDLDFLQAYIDGRLPDDQVRALETRLRADPRFADMLVTLGREESILLEWARAHAAGASLDRNGLPRIMGRRRRIRRWLAAGLVVAAAAAVAFVMFGGVAIVPPAGLNSTGPVAKQDGPVYAKLEDVQGEVFVVPETGEPFAARPGQTLKFGERLRTRGEGSFAVVALANSARFSLIPDTTLQFLAGAPSMTDAGMAGLKLYLEEGTVSADVSKQPGDRPMLLKTPHAEARMLESKSSITSSAQGTRIEQDQGKKIKVTRNSDGRSIEVPNGWYAVAPANASDQFAPQPMPTPISHPRNVLKEGIGPVQVAAYSPDGRVLALGCADATIRFWNLSSNSLLFPPIKAGGKAAVRSIAYSPDGAIVAAVAEDKHVKLYTAANGKELVVLKGHKTAVSSLAFSPDGTLLASAGSGNRNAEVKIWSVEGRMELASLTGHANGVLAVAFAPDSRTLATAGRDGTVKIWDVATREVKHNLTGHSAQVNCVAFSPDGMTLATGCKDKTVKLWDTKTGAERKTFQGMLGEVRSVAFSLDGMILAAADQNVRLWDVMSGQQLALFRGHNNAVTSLAFAPGGKEIATAGMDRTIQIWDVSAARSLPVPP
jgi:WD40 repeat protein